MNRCVFLVHINSHFQVGVTLLLKANFLVLILAKCIYCLCSDFLVLSSLVVVQQSSNFFNTLSIIIYFFFLSLSFCWPTRWQCNIHGPSLFQFVLFRLYIVCGIVFVVLVILYLSLQLQYKSTRVILPPVLLECPVYI